MKGRSIHPTPFTDFMNVLVSGASGFVGSALVPFLLSSGHRVTRLVRTQSQPGESAVRWNPEEGIVDGAGLEDVEAVVHLAGDSIFGRWTPEKRAKIRDSRVNGTRLLAESVARAARRPSVLVCASAIGYYGNRGEEILREDSASGCGFLAQVCREWEAAAEPAAQAGIRVVNLRIGVVLSPQGGALAKMLPPFRMGLGGILGNGRQYMSWIAIDDLLGIVAHVLTTERVVGPVNAVAPTPVTNREFTERLGRVLRRPTLFPMPAFAARLAFGEMADELFLASARVLPTALSSSGYSFRHPELESALRSLLERS